MKRDDVCCPNCGHRMTVWDLECPFSQLGETGLDVNGDRALGRVSQEVERAAGSANEREKTLEETA